MINELKVELDKSKKFFFSYFMLSMVALILGLLLPSYLDYKATEAQNGSELCSSNCALRYLYSSKLILKFSG